MINSDQGSPNISKAKLIGQSERLWCVCFMFSPRYSKCSCFSLSSQTWFSSPGVRDIPCKLQVKTLSYSQISKQKRKCWKNGKSWRISPSSFGAPTMSIDRGLALQVVGGGVAWLVDRQLRAARQLNRGEQPPALVTGRVGDGDAPGGQVRQRLLDVVTHQVELVLARPVCGMHGDLGWRHLEDQPATAGVDPCKSEHVTDEDSISLRVCAVENDVCSVDHVSLSLSWSSTVSFRYSLSSSSHIRTTSSYC